MREQKGFTGCKKISYMIKSFLLVLKVGLTVHVIYNVMMEENFPFSISSTIC
jgi:hypothetical protein